MVVISAPATWADQDVARLDGAAVDVDGAGAALGGVAADVGAGEVEVLADRVHEEGVGWRVDGDLSGR